jgi:hypothetical protein
MTDDPLTERECWQAMDAMIDHISHLESELFKIDILFAVLAIVALGVVVL